MKINNGKKYQDSLVNTRVIACHSLCARPSAIDLTYIVLFNPQNNPMIGLLYHNCLILISQTENWILERLSDLRSQCTAPNSDLLDSKDHAYDMLNYFPLDKKI